MELDKKTTILFSLKLHKHLVKLAKQQGVSLGKLVREACIDKYGYVPLEERLKAVEEIGELNLPIGDPGKMKRESVPAPGDLLP